MTRRDIWTLVLAGLTLKGDALYVPALSEHQSLALVSPDMDKLQGWFAKFIKEDEAGCWIWHGARFRGGYGAVGWNGTSTSAHRVIYQILVSPLSRKLDLDHLCRNRACVNPDHLEPVSRSENLRRGAHPTQGALGRRVA